MFFFGFRKVQVFQPWKTTNALIFWCLHTFEDTGLVMSFLKSLILNHKVFLKFITHAHHYIHNNLKMDEMSPALVCPKEPWCYLIAIKAIRIKNDYHKKRLIFFLMYSDVIKPPTQFSVQSLFHNNVYEVFFSLSLSL